VALTADDVIRFIEEMTTLGGSFAGQPFELLEFQKSILRDIYAADEDGNRLKSRYLLGLPRKSGKSQIGAAIALAHLVIDDADARPLVVSAASDRAQARLVFEEAKRMVLASPELSEHLTVFRNEIQNPHNGGRYVAVSADAGSNQGLNPSCVIVDELHVFKNSDLLEALTMGSAMRKAPLFLIISTAGFDLASPMGRLYSYGLTVDGHMLNGKTQPGEITDTSFGMDWWGPEPGEEYEFDDPAVWERFNPAWSVMPNPIGIMQAAIATAHEASFVRFHLNGWTSSESTWLPSGAWEACSGGPDLVDGERVVLGFDGAWKGDSTALVAVRLSDLHISLLNLWEAPPNNPQWRTPTFEVEEAIREACKKFKVVEITADPYRFERSLSMLYEEGLPIVEFPTNSLARMVPACQTFFEKVMDGELSHDGGLELARHLTNCVIKEDHRGARIQKEAPGSPRKIDAAVAAVIGLHRAAMHRDDEQREPQLLVL